MESLVAMLSFFLLFLLPDVTFCGKPASMTVLVVLDGFRHDYFDESYSAPNLRSLTNKGVLVPDVAPVFPSSRFPNVASLITGMFAENHEVLDQEVFDVELNKTVRHDELGFWNQTRAIRTIWDLHQSAKGNRMTKVLGFPDKEFVFPDPVPADPNPAPATNGSTTPEPPALPKPEIRSSGIEPGEQKWQGDLLSSFDDCLKECNTSSKSDLKAFITVFLEEPGATAQALGPDAVQQVVTRVDGFVGDLVDKIKKLGWGDVTNVVIVSTPGYTDVRADSLVMLKSFLKKESQQIGFSPLINLRQEHAGNEIDYVLDTYNGLLNEKADGNFEVFIRSTIPERYHYGHSLRMQPIVVLANPGSAFAEDFRVRINDLNTKFNRTSDPGNIYGLNGYDNELPDMHTLMVAQGPAFIADKGRLNASETVNVSMVDLFPMLCLALGVDVPANRNGSVTAVGAVLTGFKHKPLVEQLNNLINYASSPDHLPITASLALASLVVVLALMCVLLARRRRKRAAAAAQHGFRYSQVKNNRRLSGGDGNIDQDFSEDEADDKLGLLAAMGSGGGGAGSSSGSTRINMEEEA